MDIPKRQEAKFDFGFQRQALLCLRPS